MAEGRTGSRQETPPKTDEIEVLEFTFQAGPDFGDQVWPLRLVMVDDEPWFLATDVCRIAKCPMVVVFNGAEEDYIRIDRRYLGVGRSALGGSSTDVFLVSEVKFYEISLGYCCDRPQREFARWVRREVLPTVRHISTTPTRRIDLPVVRATVKIDDRPAVVAPGGRLVRQKPRMEDRKPTSLYRFYDADDRLLYVGITWSVKARTRKHRTVQPWWQDARDIRIETYPNRRLALAAERTAIHIEKPLYNIQQAA